MVPLNMTYLHCLQHSLFEHLFNLYELKCCQFNNIQMLKWKSVILPSTFLDILIFHIPGKDDTAYQLLKWE